MSDFTFSFVLILLAGLFQGTFGLGMKRYSPLAYEAFWLIFAVVGMIVAPYLWASAVVPDVLAAISAAPIRSILLALGFSAFWGLGALMFGMAINYVGLSIAYGISMGLAAAIGSLIPLFEIPDISSNPAVPFIIIGVVVMVLGVIVVSYAGVKRDKMLAGASKEASVIRQGKLFKIGLLFAVLNGVFSAFLNIGFTKAAPAAQAAVAQGALERNASLVAWVVCLFGGCLVNIIYALVQLIRNKSLSSLAQKGAFKGILWAIGTAVLFFAALASYGQGAALMGKLGPVLGWTMFIALALVISNAWGISGGEWKNVPRPFRILMAGNAILIISWMILGYANSL
ncbi:MAG: L-rhamnose/proton symporter RhaT [Candidatus Zhuqueibacterota bacterium]